MKFKTSVKCKNLDTTVMLHDIDCVAGQGRISADQYHPLQPVVYPAETPAMQAIHDMQSGI